VSLSRVPTILGAVCFEEHQETKGDARQMTETVKQMASYHECRDGDARIRFGASDG
jgi:hypothetical protein